MELKGGFMAGLRDDACPLGCFRLSTEAVDNPVNRCLMVRSNARTTGPLNRSGVFCSRTKNNINQSVTIRAMLTNRVTADASPVTGAMCITVTPHLALPSFRPMGRPAVLQKKTPRQAGRCLQTKTAYWAAPAAAGSLMANSSSSNTSTELAGIAGLGLWAP